jgi:DNA-binding transcriptional ArsR family regulator
MIRDFELIRNLLFLFESKLDSSMIEHPEIDGFDKSQIRYHLRLLNDAGLLRCELVTSSRSERVISVVPFELTWEGVVVR